MKHKIISLLHFIPFLAAISLVIYSIHGLVTGSKDINLFQQAAIFVYMVILGWIFFSKDGTESKITRVSFGFISLFFMPYVLKFLTYISDNPEVL